jgi:hypothetical protein
VASQTGATASPRLSVAVYPPTELVEVLSTGLFGYVPKRAGVDAVVTRHTNSPWFGVVILRRRPPQNHVATCRAYPFEVTDVDQDFRYVVA